MSFYKLNLIRETYPDKPSFFILCGMAAFAGGSGAFVGTPADLALVRMTIDGRQPPGKLNLLDNSVFYMNNIFITFFTLLKLELRRNYKNVFNAFIRIAKEEGITKLWRGSVATMTRAVIVNVSQLATYSQSKVLIHSHCTFLHRIFFKLIN